MATFAEAKKEWLKEIGNKSWEQLHAELEAESDAKFAKIRTPEYIARWNKNAGVKEDAKKGK